jgi:hypothetical protein
MKIEEGAGTAEMRSLRLLQIRLTDRQTHRHTDNHMHIQTIPSPLCRFYFSLVEYSEELGIPYVNIVMMAFIVGAGLLVHLILHLSSKIFITAATIDSYEIDGKVQQDDEYTGLLSSESSA